MVVALHTAQVWKAGRLSELVLEDGRKHLAEHTEGLAAAAPVQGASASSNTAPNGH